MTATIVNESLNQWIEDNRLNAKFIHNKVIEVPGAGKFVIVEPKDITVNVDNFNRLLEGVIFDQEFQILLSDSENVLVDNADYVLFQFGTRWYYCDTLTPEELKEFRYIGSPNVTFDSPAPFLGVHAGYELCNGSRNYSDWISKAKFLCISTLGLCEENTLAGTLAFQQGCLKSKIKPIIGETVTILADNGSKMQIKLYVKNNDGWRNLLAINKIINVDNNGEFIREKELFNPSLNTLGLVCVLTTDVDLAKYWTKDKFQYYFHECYFQIDFVEWGSSAKDEAHLKAIKNYFENYLFSEGSTLLPILICDAYYLEQKDYEIKKHLNNIGKVGFKNSSKDQYFKCLDDIYLQAAELFSETDDRWNLIMELAVENLNSVCAGIDFEISTGENYFPEYEMTDGEEKLYASNEEMFMALIYDGLESKIINRGIPAANYIDRIEKEVEVIKFGNLIDYFLILNDIIRWCKTQDILVGIGRGSSAGSVVNYFLDITNIDPLKYNLLFERFLNKSRVLVSKADIDSDFPTSRRDEVKRYIEQKYGTDYVASIGTYSSFKAKGAIKDLGREYGADFSKTNFITSIIDDAKSSLTDLFKLGTEKPDIREYIQKNWKAIEKIPLLLNQPKAASVHASGVIIVPKAFGNIYNQMPIKKVDGLLVSEWEGEYVDSAGFLKADILGIKQLDKLADIIKLIEANHGHKINFEDIGIDNADVMDLFKEGLTADVFQFGTQGLAAYCKEMRPDGIEDLIAAVSLYRPGPMDSGMHKKFIKIKHGEEKPNYDEGTEEITRHTHGQIVYQEQVMEIFVQVGGFDLVEADVVRAAMGKKQLEKLIPYKDKFINGAVSKGYNRGRITELYNKMEAFASYAFNRSHAASYALTGYYCQWFKQKYPIEFWTISLQYAEEKEIINRISEITKISNIEVAGVDVNKSTTTFFADPSTNTVYWALNSVKWVGDKGVDELIAERTANGNFYSVEEFCERVKDKKGINKRTIINLILAGGFDKMEKITPEHRGRVIKKYHDFTNIKMAEDLLETASWKPYQWVLRQKELTGFGFIDYLRIVRSSNLFATKQKFFKENADLLFANSEDEQEVVASGILQAIIERKSKKGVFAQLEIIDNTDKLYITVWNDIYMPYRTELAESKNKIIILSGKLVYDNYKQSNVIQSKLSTKIEII